MRTLKDGLIVGAMIGAAAGCYVGAWYQGEQILDGLEHPETWIDDSDLPAPPAPEPDEQQTQEEG